MPSPRVHAAFFFVLRLGEVPQTSRLPPLVHDVPRPCSPALLATQRDGTIATAPFLFFLLCVCPTFLFHRIDVLFLFFSYASLCECASV